MADSQTQYYSLIKPEIGGSIDTWGVKLNANADIIDSTLQACAKLSGAQPFTGQQTFNNGIKIGNYTLTVTGDVLQIKYSGTLIGQIDSSGVFTAKDVVADPTIT